MKLYALTSLLLILWPNCLAQGAGIPSWLFFCRNHDVVIAKGVLEKRNLSAKINVDVFGRDAKRPDFKGGEALAVVRTLKIEEVFSPNRIFPMNRLEEAGDFDLEVVIGLIRHRGVEAPRISSGEGYFVLMWCPFLLDPVYKVVDQFEEKDLKRALVARNEWRKDMKQPFQIPEGKSD